MKCQSHQWQDQKHLFERSILKRRCLLYIRFRRIDHRDHANNSDAIHRQVFVTNNRSEDEVLYSISYVPKGSSYYYRTSVPTPSSIAASRFRKHTTSTTPTTMEENLHYNYEKRQPERNLFLLSRHQHIPPEHILPSSR
ncbi:hypothetical protein ACMFMF_004578 [Clarireedia jacksonii]